MISNRDDIAGSGARELALDCIEAGIAAAHPERVVRSSVTLSDDGIAIEDRTYELDDYENLLVVGGGKAAGAVVTALSTVLGDRLRSGAVVVDEPVDAPVEVYEGGHPVPDETGVAGAERILELTGEAGEGTLVLAVITGGGSALMTAPAAGVDLEDVRAVTDAMLDAGMAIDEINAVRKHLSSIKGGQLARAAAPATVVSLVFSDVVGDDLGVIASGPTAPDRSTFADARSALERHGVEVPASVRERLRQGVDGEVPETPDVGDPAFDDVNTHVLADGRTALEAARQVADDAGYEATILSSRIRGEAREVAKVHAAVAEECHATGSPVEPPAAVLSGGEVTVTVRGEGTGGPSAEFALQAGLELAGTEGTTVAAVDTDGIDGKSDAAGGIVDGETVEDVSEARAAMADSDAATYLERRQGAVVTGPTGTNVNDLRVVVLEEGT